ncbi:hypothetical protein LX36DRAFT_660667, partial [Colletotrichum falcatum]
MVHAGTLSSSRPPALRFPRCLANPSPLGREPWSTPVGSRLDPSPSPARVEPMPYVVVQAPKI